MGAKQVVAAMAAAGASLAFVPAKADPVADFYKGKQISWVLSAGEGGGYSSYARAFAPFLSAHIPGNPKIVIQNMPGAGGIRAMNYLFSVAPKDGTVIALVHSSVPFAPLYGLQGASFDPRKMNWIGSMNATTAICVAWHTSGIKDWRDMMSKEYLVGGTGAGSQMETMPAMLNHLFGTKMKVISGYKGGNDVYLAMERGEVAGRCGGLYSSISSTRPDWFPQKKVAVPIQVAVERNPHFPDVPAVGEFAKDEQTKNVLKLILSPLQMDRPILLPPGAPAERVEALRRAFHDAINDPAFIAEAAKQRIEIEEVAGDKVARIVEDAFAMPPEVIKAAKESMSLTGGATE